MLNLLLDFDVVRCDIAADGRIDTSPDDLRRLPSNLRAIYHDLWRQPPDALQRVLECDLIRRAWRPTIARDG